MNIKRDFPQPDIVLRRRSLTASRYCIPHLTFIHFHEKKISRTMYFLFNDTLGRLKDKLTEKSSRAG